MDTNLPHASPRGDWKHAWCTPTCPWHALPVKQDRDRREGALYARKERKRLYGALERMSEVLFEAVLSNKPICGDDVVADTATGDSVRVADLVMQARSIAGSTFGRAGGECVCAACWRIYYDHPKDPDEPWLNVLCDGSAVKL